MLTSVLNTKLRDTLNVERSLLFIYPLLAILIIYVKLPSNYYLCHCSRRNIKAYIRLLNFICFVTRITEKQLSLTRPAQMIGRYAMLSHLHTEDDKNPQRLK